MGLVPADVVMGMPMVVGAHTTDEVQSALDWASAAVESYCERKFAQQLGDEVVVDPHFSHVKAMQSVPPMASYGSYPGYGVSFSAVGSPYVGTALLPDPPVTAVQKVEAWMPMAADDGAADWVELTNFQWAQDGLIWDTSGMPGAVQSNGGPVPSWPRMPRSLRVTYDHGFVLPGAEGPGPPLPDGVVQAVIRAAAYFLLNPAGPGLATSKVGDVSNTFTQIGGPATGPGGPLDTTVLGEYRLVHL